MLTLIEGEKYYSIDDFKGYEVTTKRNSYFYLCRFDGSCSAIKYVYENTSQEDFDKKFFSSHLDAMEAHWERKKLRSEKSLKIVEKLRHEGA